MSAQEIPGILVTVDPAEVTQELLRACKWAGTRGSMAQDTRESAEAAKAALAFAQAIVILDPTLGSDGVPLDHQLDMEDRRAAAAKPQPVKRSVRVKRDSTGKASSYETEG